MVSNRQKKAKSLKHVIRFVFYQIQTQKQVWKLCIPDRLPVRESYEKRQPAFNIHFWIA
jgi:hypothetical protein